MMPIPNGILPVPRLIVWHGDVERPGDAKPLGVLHRTYHKAIDHGVTVQGVTAGGNDWSGWHLPDPEAVAGLAKVARSIAPKHWTILEEQETPS